MSAETSSSSEDEKFLQLKEYTEEEIVQHDKDDDVWISIDARVYDISTFKAEHPGGGDVLMDVAGKDATEAFEDIFHSENAREQLPDLCVGRVQGKTPGQHKPASSSTEDDSSGMQYGFLLILLFLIAAAVYQVYFVQGGGDDDAAVDIAAATADVVGEL